MAPQANGLSIATCRSCPTCGLPQPCPPLHHVNQIVNNPVLKPHHYVQVAQANIGVDHLRNERYDQATRFFRRAIQVEPRYAFAHTQLAGALLKLNRTPRAMRLFQRSLQLDPDQPQAGKIRYVLDQYKAAQGRLPAAAPDFSDEAADLEESPPTPPAPTAVNGEGES